MKIHGTLECWQELPNHCLIGFIYGDTKDRFKDASRIRTSKVDTFGDLAEGDVVRTQNSNYLLGAPAEEWGDPDDIAMEEANEILKYRV